MEKAARASPGVRRPENEIMTGTYEWNPTPHRVDVTCPTCKGRAEFEFAEVVQIKLKADVELFQASSSFEYQQFQDSCGHYWHAAVYFEGLHGSPRGAIHGLPDGYSPDDWEHSKYLRSNRGNGVGSMRCEQCGARKKHTLNWPEDSYYAIAYRGQILWAFHRESALELLHYLLSANRDVSKYRWGSFLLHVPTLFKTHKARAAVAKQLQKLLAPKLSGRRSIRAAALRRPLASRVGITGSAYVRRQIS